MIKFKRVAIVLLASIAIFYPLLIYWGIQRFEPKYIGIAAAAIYMLRTLLVSKRWRTRGLATLGLLGFSLCIWLSNSEYLLTLVPVFISVGALAVFAHSYFEPPTLPAQFALRVHGTLSEKQVMYTNNVTLIWMLFFCINGSIALYTALFCSKETWTLYNGLISYILIGTLFACEFAYRTLIFQKKEGR